ncbi:hypothetical protein BDV37DRAFT_132979 [Aspergillus pseudonomiae]|uniref:Uncharacterized protein n=1 Tax=Aspergillus pseudonomiae TaxID=1506151 RepID=A0A5N7DAY6_9EURO|nr:uncharacterized protein BDV37DRAFT_132979 [Aspergillus pseudonomiae]KAE8403551.1 hypothetical protein BDV37DRAFT_132979 [Aspergillus pseudonomiae]
MGPPLRFWATTLDHTPPLSIRSREGGFPSLPQELSGGKRLMKDSDLSNVSEVARRFCTTSVSLGLCVSPWIWRVWRLVAFYPGTLAFLQGYILSRRAPGRSSLQPQDDPHVLHATGVS